MWYSGFRFNRDVLYFSNSRWIWSFAPMEFLQVPDRPWGTSGSSVPSKVERVQECQIFTNSTLLLQFSKFAVRKYFSGVSYMFFSERGIKKMCRERGHNLETEGREFTDLFEDTAFDPEWNWKTRNMHYRKMFEH